MIAIQDQPIRRLRRPGPSLQKGEFIQYLRCSGRKTSTSTEAKPESLQGVSKEVREPFRSCFRIALLEKREIRTFSSDEHVLIIGLCANVIPFPKFALFCVLFGKFLAVFSVKGGRVTDTIFRTA